MSQLTVVEDAAAVAAPRGALLQNLGPGTLWVGDSAVDETEGIRLFAGQCLGGVGRAWVYASGDNCDVRAGNAASLTGSIDG